MRLHVSIMVRSDSGWGVCGKYLALELSRLTDTRLITSSLSPDAVDDFEWHALERLLPTNADFQNLPTVNGVTSVGGPLLTAIPDLTMPPPSPVTGNPVIGYTFFEHDVIPPEYVANARRHYHHISAGSTWCAEVLKSHGLTAVDAVVQGVDASLFHPAPEETHRTFLRDHFVIFSGGKFELRKGQDVVIRACKVMQDRHKDVFLVNSWFNPWEASLATMRASRLIRFAPQFGDYAPMMKQVLAENGLDLTRVMVMPPRWHSQMARAYHNSDIGVFPNRCEGGTNLVLMEYMACGKPALATATTGHADVVSENHSLVIQTRGHTVSQPAPGVLGHWPEPALDDVIDKLEWAYQNRVALREIGRRAGDAMKPLNWKAAAEQFLATARRLSAR